MLLLVLVAIVPVVVAIVVVLRYSCEWGMGLAEGNSGVCAGSLSLSPSLVFTANLVRVGESCACCGREEKNVNLISKIAFIELICKLAKRDRERGIEGEREGERNRERKRSRWAESKRF